MINSVVVCLFLDLRFVLDDVDVSRCNVAWMFDF